MLRIKYAEVRSSYYLIFIPGEGSVRHYMMNIQNYFALNDLEGAKVAIDRAMKVHPEHVVMKV